MHNRACPVDVVSQNWRLFVALIAARWQSSWQAKRRSDAAYDLSSSSFGLLGGDEAWSILSSM